MKTKLILMALLLLLIPLGIGFAQSTKNFELRRFTLSSGGESTSTNYTVDSVIGQPLAKSSQSDNYVVISGFAPAFQQSAGPGTTIWLPLVRR